MMLVEAAAVTVSLSISSNDASISSIYTSIYFVHIYSSGSNNSISSGIRSNCVRSWRGTAGNMGQASYCHLLAMSQVVLLLKQGQ